MGLVLPLKAWHSLQLGRRMGQRGPPVGCQCLVQLLALNRRSVFAIGEGKRGQDGVGEEKLCKREEDREKEVEKVKEKRIGKRKERQGEREMRKVRGEKGEGAQKASKAAKGVLELDGEGTRP